MPANLARAAGSQPNGLSVTSPAGEPVASQPGAFPVVGIGASAGGLEACGKFLSALPPDTGMAFILVQHLDPAHESMMVDLLASRTSLVVQQAVDGMPVRPGHLYVIPPAMYLSVGDNKLHLSHPLARHGARMPFDFLLSALAEEYGPNAICIALSGTGTDGSLGVIKVKDKGGYVIAQDPVEAGFDGMPRGVINSGAVDLVLPAARIPAALIRHVKMRALGGLEGFVPTPDTPGEFLPEVIALLHVRTSYDFRLY
jgi:two-component system CheB/CheR fusion protein